jgi:hypothetical protein
MLVLSLSEIKYERSDDAGRQASMLPRVRDAARRQFGKS